MKMAAVLAVVLFGCIMAQAQLVERQNLPLAETTFSPKENPTAKKRIRMDMLRMKVIPVAVQSIKRDHKSMRIVVALAIGVKFDFGSIVITADGERILEPTNAAFQAGWWEARAADIPDMQDVARKIASAKEVYVTVLLSNNKASDFNQLSVLMTPEQIANFKLVLQKYDDLEPKS